MEDGDQNDRDWWDGFKTWLTRWWWLFGLMLLWYNATPPRICVKDTPPGNVVEEWVKSACNVVPGLEIAPSIGTLMLLLVGITGALWLTKQGERRARKRAKRQARQRKARMEQAADGKEPD